MDWNVSASAADSDGFLLHLARLAIFDFNIRKYALGNDRNWFFSFLAAKGDPEFIEMTRIGVIWSAIRHGFRTAAVRAML